MAHSMILLMMLQIQFLLIDFRWDRENTMAEAAQQLLHRRDLDLASVWKSKMLCFVDFHRLSKCQISIKKGKAEVDYQRG